MTFLALLAAGLGISPSIADTGLIRAVVTKGGFIIGEEELKNVSGGVRKSGGDPLDY